MLVGSWFSSHPLPFPLKMSLIPVFTICVSMMTEMEGEQTVAFAPLDYSGCTFLPGFCSVNSWGQSLHLAFNVRDEQIINFRTK